MVLNNEVEVQVPASQAWQLLGEEFGEIAQWALSITKSSLNGPLQEGVVRSCEISGFGPFQASTITEELVHFDRDTLSFRYQARAGLPPLMAHAENHWQVHETGPQSCRITSQAKLQLAWWAWPMSPLLKLQIKRESQGFLQQLRHRLEEGVPLPTTKPV